MAHDKLRIGITSTIVALGCAGITYALYKYKQRVKKASDAFNYLKIHVVTTETACEEVVAELRRGCAKYCAIGFDCEWVTDNGKRKPIAMIQLSTFDGVCGLFRMNELNKMCDSLKDLLEDKNIYKVGVAPLDDAKYLHQDYSVNITATLDVRHVIRHTMSQYSDTGGGGLAGLAKTFLGVILDKSWRVRCSDWSAPQLTDRQIKYAAADAYVAIKIYVDVLEKYSKGNTLPWPLNIKRSVLTDLPSKFWLYADVKFKSKSSSNSNNGNKSKDTEPKPSKEVILKKRYPHAMRSKPLYHNCFLEAPDGELLCTCDNKKALWYVERQLADIVKEDPLTVRLRFEPSGRSVGDVGRYYQLTKLNQCVVCGHHQTYIRKNIVPREYRKHFPEIMKEHSSHDVVLLCSSCHQRSNIQDQALREELARTCHAPLASHLHTKYSEDADCKKLRSASRALLYQSRKHVLPDERRKELEDFILQHYPQHDVITEELLNEVANIQYVVDNPDFESHGLKVVEYYSQRDGLLDLEQTWREHFLKSMRPSHMPELWSLKHNEERLRVKFNEGRLSVDDVKVTGFTKYL